MHTSATKMSGSEFGSPVGEFTQAARPNAYEMSENGVLLGIAHDPEDDVARTSQRGSLPA